LLPMVFQGFWLGAPPHLPRICPLLPCAPLASLVNLHVGSYGLGLVVQWRLRILQGCLTASPSLRNGIRITE
jgi:hypothetical protein